MRSEIMRMCTQPRPLHTYAYQPSLETTIAMDGARMARPNINKKPQSQPGSSSPLAGYIAASPSSTTTTHCIPISQPKRRNAAWAGFSRVSTFCLLVLPGSKKEAAGGNQRLWVRLQIRVQHAVLRAMRDAYIYGAGRGLVWVGRSPRSACMAYPDISRPGA